MTKKISIEHWEKLKRQFLNVKSIQQNISKTGLPDYLKDQISHFFQDCFHLKDWLKKDEPLLKQDIEELFDYMRGLEPFKVCADFANREKHSEANKVTRIDPNTSIKGIVVNVTIGVKEPTTYSWQIFAAGKSYDVFELADNCMQEWRVFIKNKSLSYLN